jgi:hypothetical protein
LAFQPFSQSFGFHFGVLGSRGRGA